VASPGPRYEEAVASLALGDLLRAQIMLSDLKLRLRLLTDPRPEVELFVLRILTLADTVSLSDFVRGVVPQNASQKAAGGRTAPAEPRLDLAPAASPDSGATQPAPEVVGTFGQVGVSDDPVLNLKVGVPADADLPSEPWERFLVLLRKKAPWAASELRRGSLEGHDEKAARFFVPDTNPFNQERLNSTGIQTAIREAFGSAYGLKPKIQFRFGEGRSGPADTQTLLAENADLAGLIAATDGEIVARRPRTG